MAWKGQHYSGLCELTEVQQVSFLIQKTLVTCPFCLVRNDLGLKAKAYQDSVAEALQNKGSVN